MRHPPIWEHCHAWTTYAYPWSQLLARWKFGQQPGLGRHFARWMQQSSAVITALEHAQVVIAVPLSAQRMREHGYNPAAQMAQMLAPRKNLVAVLVRQRHTAPQSHLTRAQRLRNVRAAFSVPSHQQAPISQRRVLLIDDVMTTGATLHAATRCLLKAGAASVQVLCVARTP